VPDKMHYVNNWNGKCGHNG